MCRILGVAPSGYDEWLRPPMSSDVVPRCRTNRGARQHYRRAMSVFGHRVSSPHASRPARCNDGGARCRCARAACRSSVGACRSSVAACRSTVAACKSSVAACKSSVAPCSSSVAPCSAEEVGDTVSIAPATSVLVACTRRRRFSTAGVPRCSRERRARHRTRITSALRTVTVGRRMIRRLSTHDRTRRDAGGPSRRLPAGPATRAGRRGCLGAPRTRRPACASWARVEGGCLRHA